MSNDNLITYKINRAKSTLNEAIYLSEAGYWNAVANRLYYATYYAVTALIIRDNVEVKTHSGAKQIFHKNYILTNIISKEHGILYSNLFRLRTSGDYDDFVILEKIDIEPYIEQAENFIADIEKLINSEI